MVWKIESLRRIWYALPFLAAALVGFVSLAALLYEEVFDLDERARGFVAAVRRALPARRPDRRRPHRHEADRRRPRPGDAVRGAAAVVSSLLALAFAFTPWLWLAIIINGAPRPRGWRACCPGSSPPARWPSRRGPGRSGSRSSRSGSSPACCSCPSSGPSATAGASAGGLALMAPVFLIGGLVIASSGRMLERGHHPGVDRPPPPGRRWPTSAARAGPSCCWCGASTSPTATCRCCSASTSRSTRARSSPCSAPTAPASRRCSRPSPAWSRPTAAR